jgi:hypothetical protein
MPVHAIFTDVPFAAVREYNAEHPGSDRLCATGPSYKLHSDALPESGHGVFAVHYYDERPTDEEVEAIRQRLGAAQATLSEV